ncbi:MAG: type I-C CRISPR-associated protein Cas8c/Csd1 [Neomegalonema sp.]|nr:type I-C CRISPR-associated protein Cas8c/Csd1 [Neomegalonema sp.]
MTILTALAQLYERLEREGEAPPIGYAFEKISFEMVISPEGKPLELKDLRNPEAKNKSPRMDIAVPSSGVNRTSGIAPNSFWDKTAYSLGVTAVENDAKESVAGQGKRTQREHEAFVNHHLELLTGVEHPHLIALRRFLESWTPDQFEALNQPEALDQNIVFRMLDDERRFIHELPEAKALIAQEPYDAGAKVICLDTGAPGPHAQLHPTIKGVMGAQSSGAALVSFNADAFDSYGKRSGANSPMSQHGASAYGAALNTLLRRGSSRSLRIGETTVVFWTEIADADRIIAAALDPSEERQASANQLFNAWETIEKGKSQRIAPDIEPGISTHMLGLSPNAARLSVRFWHVGTFGDFEKRMFEWWGDMRLEPNPFKRPPAAWALLYETAVQRKAENIPPLLGGELMRAILTGGPLPRTLLSAVIMRIRADGDINGARAAICKAAINRALRLKEADKKEMIPVSLDPTSEDIAYNLGRLFAAYAHAEKSAADRNASIRDKYMGAASATPLRVFPTLMRGYEHNRSKLFKGDGKQRGSGVRVEQAIAQITENFHGAIELPVSQTLEDQSRFFVGFYHQEREFYRKSEKTETNEAEQ